MRPWESAPRPSSSGGRTDSQGRMVHEAAWREGVKEYLMVGRRAAPDDLVWQSIDANVVRSALKAHAPSRIKKAAPKDDLSHHLGRKPGSPTPTQVHAPVIRAGCAAFGRGRSCRDRRASACWLRRWSGICCRRHSGTWRSPRGCRLISRCTWSLQARGPPL